MRGIGTIITIVTITTAITHHTGTAMPTRPMGIPIRSITATPPITLTRPTVIRATASPLGLVAVIITTVGGRIERGAGANPAPLPPAGRIARHLALGNSIFLLRRSGAGLRVSLGSRALLPPRPPVHQ